MVRLRYQCAVIGYPFHFKMLCSEIERSLEKSSLSSFGLRVSIGLDGTIECQVRELPSRNPMSASTGLWQKHPQGWDDIKHSQRDRWTTVQRNQGTDEIVWIDSDSYLVECINGNVFCWEEDILSTPKIDGRLLSGIMRVAVLVLANEFHLRTVISDIRYSQSSELFFTSSLRGFVPLRIEGHGSSDDFKDFSDRLWSAMLNEAFQHRVYEAFTSQSWR